MGGINCPPPEKAGEASALVDEYIMKLARYCELFFSGVANFWGANAQVERVVQEGGDFSDVLTSFAGACEDLSQARAALDTVAALWGSLSDERIEFSDQMVMLDRIITGLETASLELSVISGDAGREIQYKLWEGAASPSLADLAELISTASVWQIQFSKSSRYLAV